MLRSAAICLARLGVTGMSCDNHVPVGRICAGPSLELEEEQRPFPMIVMVETLRGVQEVYEHAVSRGTPHNGITWHMPPQ